MPGICVVHLVRARNGIEPFDRFLGSYLANPAGIPHTLMILLKGFHGMLPPSYGSILAPIPHRIHHVPDRGFDIVPYFEAARKFDHDYFCFLNSHSVILERDWLSKLHAHAALDDVGLTGATGSWESMYSNLQSIIDGKKAAGQPFWKRLLSPLDTYLLGYYEKRFEPFPNYHIRTNAFMVRRKVLLDVRCPSLVLKSQAHAFESGRNGLTKQILRKDLRPLVVGRDGTGYEKEHWDRSGTFRQGDQANLLIADNQTMTYIRLTVEEKEKIRFQTWGGSCPRTYAEPGKSAQ